jgi:hypothetical protein
VDFLYRGEGFRQELDAAGRDEAGALVEAPGLGVSGCDPQADLLVVGSVIAESLETRMPWQSGTPGLRAGTATRRFMMPAIRRAAGMPSGNMLPFRLTCVPRRS